MMPQINKRWLILLLFSWWPASVYAEIFVPTELGGDIGYTYTLNDYENSPEKTSNNLTARIRSKAYIWQPWFINTNADINFTQNQTKVDTSTSDSSIITGQIRFGVLPISLFPFSLSYRHSDSLVTHENSNIDPLLSDNSSRHTTRDQINISQGYYGKRYRVNAKYGHNETNSDSGDYYNQESYGLDYSFRAPKHDLTAAALQSTYSGNYDDTNTDGENNVFTVNHRYYPDSSLSVDSLASQTSTTNIYAADPATGIAPNVVTDIGQVSSNISWRSSERPLRINGGVRVHQVDTLVYNESDSSSNGLHTNIGAGYQFSDKLNSSAAAHYSTGTADGEDTSSQGESANLSYNGDSYKIFSFDYGWNTGINGSHQKNDAEETSSYGLSLGHNATRTWKLDRQSRLRLSLNQSYSVQDVNTLDYYSESLGSSMSLGWTQTSSQASNYIQLNLSDSRSISGEDSKTQLINLQASRKQFISRRSSLNANISYQYSHNLIEGGTDYGANRNYNAAVGYNFSRPFALQNITFRSDLRVNNSMPAIGDETTTTDWDNYFTHSIGKLKSNLNFRITEKDGAKSSVLILQIKRVF